MSNWICSECGANYIDVSHQEPSVLREELELRKVKQQLAIAVEALKWYDGLEKMLIGWEIATGQERGTAEKALHQIKELDK